jgi:chromosomal replication initiation ATPase DnaA
MSNQIPKCDICGKSWIHISESEDFQKWLKACNMLDEKIKIKMKHQLIKGEYIRPCNCEWDKIKKDKEVSKFIGEVAKIFKSCCIPQELRDIKYNERLLPESNYNKVLHDFNKHITNGMSGQVLIDLCGNPGRGKTTACAFTLRNAGRLGKKIIYIMAKDLAFLEMKNKTMYAYLIDCDYVVIDDLGLDDNQNKTPNVYYTIKNLVENGKTVVTIRNIPKKIMLERMEFNLSKNGDGIFESLFKRFHTEEVKGVDLRPIYKNKGLQK